MYKKFILQMFLCNMILIAGWFCVKGTQMNRLASTPAFQLRLTEDYTDPKVDRFFGILRKASSGQRVVDYSVIEKERKYHLSQEDYEALLKIVQAEAGCEDMKGKMLVAGVILNRVNSSKFPDTVTEVIMQQEKGVYQFSPVANGTYQKAKASEETIRAVERVLEGEDITDGALYFAAREYADPEKMKWFDNSLEKLFEHGGHEFFTN
ncbi:MAG: cell wall hydrolase [Suilimivivens sp.]|nr:cell wall hydrolase [Lachnospiraceae bacterium]